MKPGTHGTKKKIMAAADSFAQDALRMNRAIFDRPELCFEEAFAAGQVCDYLSGKGFSVKRGVAGLKTAFAASHKGKGRGPVVAILAEYDALPGIGHACGHSMIAAAACVAAAALTKAAPDHPGALMVIGTPAEEGGGGKIRMIEKGVFRNVDAAIMVHPSNKTRVIARMYAITDLLFEFTGKAAHAAAFPEKGINALDAGVLFYNAVSAMRQQLKGEARIHGIFTHGGDAPNIIPERVEMRFYIRTLDREYFRELKAKVMECARGAARAAGCKVSVKSHGHSYEPFYPSYPIGAAFRKNMETAGIADEGFSETEEIGSSDIGNLSQVVPTLHPEYAVGAREDINHSRNFLSAVISQKGTDAMMKMTKAMAMTVYDLLADARLMAEVKREFAGRGKSARAGG
ncbi:MAG: M20 family metallopeptidase [Nitrospinae bacterium]|nr:M20 family metallopeptidase [Nitrospinota bacterium]